ncbi:MAG: hypothetical protein ABIP49_04345 [Lysobacterales bacterium]
MAPVIRRDGQVRRDRDGAATRLALMALAIPFGVPDQVRYLVGSIGPRNEVFR